MNGRISNRATKAEMRKKGRRLFDIKTGWRNVLKILRGAFQRELWRWRRLYDKRALVLQR